MQTPSKKFTGPVMAWAIVTFVLFPGSPVRADGPIAVDDQARTVQNGAGSEQSIYNARPIYRPARICSLTLPVTENLRGFIGRLCSERGQGNHKGVSASTTSRTKSSTDGKGQSLVSSWPCNVFAPRHASPHPSDTVSARGIVHAGLSKS